jgi:hypothetical protein
MMVPSGAARPGSAACHGTESLNVTLTPLRVYLSGLRLITIPILAASETHPAALNSPHVPVIGLLSGGIHRRRGTD